MDYINSLHIFLLTYHAALFSWIVYLVAKTLKKREGIPLRPKFS